MIWTRARIGLQVCAGLSALAMLYVGFFQVHWLKRLWCPGFGIGCESVAMASFAWPFEMADGLLGAAYCGLLSAVAQIAHRQAVRGAAVLAAIWFGLHLVSLVEMHHFGAYCSWCTLAAVLSAPLLALAMLGALQPLQGDAPPALPPENPQQQ
jgi:uncharacterized membrane protein